MTPQPPQMSSAAVFVGNLAHDHARLLIEIDATRAALALKTQEYEGARARIIELEREPEKVKATRR
jgi:hypothetical protein